MTYFESYNFTIVVAIVTIVVAIGVAIVVIAVGTNVEMINCGATPWGYEGRLIGSTSSDGIIWFSWSGNMDREMRLGVFYRTTIINLPGVHILMRVMT